MRGWVEREREGKIERGEEREGVKKYRGGGGGVTTVTKKDGAKR